MSCSKFVQSKTADQMKHKCYNNCQILNFLVILLFRIFFCGEREEYYWCKTHLITVLRFKCCLRYWKIDRGNTVNIAKLNFNPRFCEQSGVHAHVLGTACRIQVVFNILTHVKLIRYYYKKFDVHI